MRHDSVFSLVSVSVLLVYVVLVGILVGQIEASESVAQRSGDVAKDLREVTIISSADGSPQHAMFWAPPDPDAAVPLLVCLHTWSGDYKQSAPRDDFLHVAQQRGWAFIHPDFRGPNVQPQACASDLAVADVLDAVAFARQQVSIDDNRIYLVGTSGGGHMALIMACRSPQTWAGVSAWVPISDLSAWHTQCMRKENTQKYAHNLEKVCGGPPGTSAQIDAEYRHRSSLFHLQNAVGLPIDINTGINDGHTGSVPVSQSLLAFNALAQANGYADQVISDKTINALLDQHVPEQLKYSPSPQDGSRKYPILLRRVAGPVRVTVFDGGHQHDTNPAVLWLEQQRSTDEPIKTP